jgi:hypothetical protein
VSKGFELFQLASVQTFQQHVRTPLSVRLAMGFLSKTQVWEDHCNRPDDVDSSPNGLIHKASCAFKIVIFFVLATFCWTKSLLCNVVAFTGMLLYPESTLHVLREDSVNFLRIYFGSLSAIQTWYSVRMLISQQHSSRRRELFVRTPISV